MKQFPEAYTNFTRTERAGLLGLFLLIGILLTIRLTMPYWIKPGSNTEENQKLATAWHNFNQQETTTTNNNNSQQNPIQNTDNQSTKNPTETTANNNNSQHQSPAALRETNSSPLGGAGGGFPFNPNTIDSAGLRKLGLREKTTAIFLNWRRKGKRFYKKEELKKLYTLTPAEYKRLEPYITIGNKLNARGYNYEEYGPLPDKVNINTADSITLIRLRGIGPGIAHRLLQKRRRAGSFTSINEVLAVYHFPDTVKAYLRQKLVME